MQENTDQKNSAYGHFLRSEYAFSPSHEKPEISPNFLVWKLCGKPQFRCRSETLSKYVKMLALHETVP